MKKGQLKPPVLPLRQVHETAMEVIFKCQKPVALFFVGGQLVTLRSTARTFEDRLVSLATGLIGVYDRGADSRFVRDDLAEFYREVA